MFLPSLHSPNSSAVNQSTLHPTEQRNDGKTKRPSSILLTGVLTAAVYFFICIFFSRGPQAYSRSTREVAIWLCVLPLLLLFRRGYRLIKQSPDSIRVRTVIGCGAVFCLITLFTFPFHSTDVFGYINRGWQQVHYGQNPYVNYLAEVPNREQDPMLRDHWIYNPVPYGFLFTLYTRAICRLGSGNWWLTLFLFKVVNILALGATAWLVRDGAKRLGHPRPILALYVLLWNPLILLHHIANGHNDILTGCLLTLVLYLAITGTVSLLVPALVAAALLKYAPAILFPLIFIFGVKTKGWRTAILSCLLGGLVLCVVSAPYLQDWRLFKLEDIQINATLIDNSLHSFLIHIYENVSRLIPALAQFHATVDTAIRLTLRLGFLVFLIVQWRRLPKNISAAVVVEKSTLVMFVLVCVASSKFNAWYMGMLLPPALLLDERHWLRRLIVLITAAEVLSLTFFKQAYMLNYFVMLLLPTLFVWRQRRNERTLAGHAVAESRDDVLPESALPDNAPAPSRANASHPRAAALH